MKRLALFVLLVLAVAHPAAAAGVVRIADGDCAGLKAAVANAALNAPPTNIVLANRGNYSYCPIAAAGNVTIDGAGASLQVATSPGVSAIMVRTGASLTIRNLNLIPTPATVPPVIGICRIGLLTYSCPLPEAPVIDNWGTLVLDTVAESGVDLSYASLLLTFGDVVLRNSSIVNTRSNNFLILVDYGDGSTSVEIDHSTILLSEQGKIIVGFPGNIIRLSNSILVPPSDGEPICDSDVPGEFISGGGNILGDDSCNAHAQNDRVVADAGLGDFGTHGGVVGTFALNYNSPAIGNGLAANCEATDARGAARGQAHCDSGAYEFGGGQGQLGVSGTTGLYFNHASNGHYVTVQRVFDGNALVIWNTFDQTGKQAWMYGIGPVNGGKIHADQVVQNVGGVLHPGGTVTGITPTLWGSFDLDVSNCYAATLSYQSVLPQFGSGTIDLERLAFVNGLDCSP
jgi:hypothetical protein